jgi:hypothetical protein
MFLVTSNLKPQKLGNFEYAYLSKYLTYIIMILHAKKRLVINQARGIYI